MLNILKEIRDFFTLIPPTKDWAFMPKIGGSNYKPALLTGEIAFDIDTKELIIGDETVEKGYHIISVVVQGPEDRLYAKVEDNRLIPMCITNAYQ